MRSARPPRLEIFREHGGARLAHNIIPYRLCRVAALTVVLHLVLCTGGEDDTGTLLGLIHTARLEELEMKSVILKVRHDDRIDGRTSSLLLRASSTFFAKVIARARSFAKSVVSSTSSRC